MAGNDPTDDTTPGSDNRGATPDDADPTEFPGAESGEEAADQADDLLEEIERRRTLRGWTVVAVAFVGIVFSAYQMWLAARGFTFELTVPGIGTYTLTSLANLQVRALHVFFALVLAFLMYPGSTGDGFLARRLSRVPDLVRARVGDGSLVRGLERLRGWCRWFFVDANRDRVTPADKTLIGLSLLPTYYYFRHYTPEVTGTIPTRGLRAANTLPEHYPALDPIAVGPLGSMSLAYLVGILAILLVLEATRRALGMLLAGLIAVFILYGRYGYLISRDIPVFGVLSTSPFRWDQIVRALWYTDQGILGVPVSVSVRFIYIFILFGAFLEMSGAGKWFIDLAYSATGTRKGGPAKASVVSSGFMGMLSGSSVANTVTTGALTIPLMKRSGYTKEFAGAVESSVSSGGQILPPVMGAAAFLIVEFTGVPFREVIIAATLPALMFFFGMWVMVHFEAAKRGVGGLPRSELLPIGPHMRRGWFYLVPILLLLYYIVIARLSIGRAGWLTIVATVALIAAVAAYNDRTGPYLLGAIGALYAAFAVSYALVGVSPVDALLGDTETGMAAGEAIVAAFWSLDLILVVVGVLILLAQPRGDAPLFDLDPAVDGAATFVDDRLGREVATTRAGRFGSYILKSMDAGARTATVVVIAVAAAGVIPGIIGLTGLPGSLRSLILTVSAGSLVLLLVFSGVSAIVVGMGMPTTVMYIVIIVLLGPTLGEFGVAILATHLFVLYLGLMADVTPPVGVAAFAAAGVAKSDPIDTCNLAFLLSLNKILVPFAFIFAPGILLLRGGDTPGEATVIGMSDVTDLGFFLPEVALPVIAVFTGVYALGIGIIGFYRGPVPRWERWSFALAAVLLSIPMMLLMPAETAAGAVGVTVEVATLSFDIALRLAGGALFAALIARNIRRDRVEAPTTTVTSDDA